MSADYVHRKSVSEMLADRSAEKPRDDGNQRPPSPASLSGPHVEWCKFPEAEQLRLRTERGFERRLAAEVRKRHAAGWSEGRLQAFAERHRRAFRRGGETQQTGQQEPCKHWRQRFREEGGDPAMEALLERTWQASVRDWMLTYPYLGTPSAPCECSLCDPHGAQMRRAERQGVLEFGAMKDDWRKTA